MLNHLGLSKPLKVALITSNFPNNRDTFRLAQIFKAQIFQKAQQIKEYDITFNGAKTMVEILWSAVPDLFQKKQRGMPFHTA